MSNLTGQGLAEFVSSKIGTPYVYGTKLAYGVFTQSQYTLLKSKYPSIFDLEYQRKIADKGLIGKVCTDCSGLITAYTENTKGSAQLYSSAYARLPMSKLSDFAIGTVLYKTGHVGTYVGKDSSGNPLCVEAKGIDFGTISGIIKNPNRWLCGLTFKDIDYSISNPIEPGLITYKDKNPYPVPKIILKKGSIFSLSVKWLQWELRQSGYNNNFTYAGIAYKPVSIDGSFGPITYAAVKAFQQSCKITIDGEVGEETRKCLLNDD